MTLHATNLEIGRFYDEARLLEPTPAEVAEALERGPKARRLHYGVAAIALAAVLLGAAFVVPPSRDALDRFFDGGSVPGTTAGLGTFPAWLEHSGSLPSSHATPGSERVIAEQDGQRLFAFRDAGSGRACLAFADDSDTCSSASDWEQLFDGHAVLKLASGVGPTADGRVAVFGLARSSVVEVELRDGASIVSRASVTNGGWVIVADQGQHDTLVGVDAKGNVVETLDARGWTWTFCMREAGCS